MSLIDSIINLISNLTIDIFAFLLSSTQVLVLFLVCWTIKEALIKMAPTLFRRLIRIALLPGDLLHSLAHVFALRLCGYEVNVRLGIRTGEVENSILIASGDHIRTRQAIFVAISPLIFHIIILAILGLTGPFFREIQSIDVLVIKIPGIVLYTYLFVCIAFYALPDLGDWMFIFHTVLNRYPYALYGYVWAGLCWMLGVVWIGYVPATIMTSIYLVLIYYSTARDIVESAEDPVKKLLEKLDLPPELVDAVPFDM